MEEHSLLSQKTFRYFTHGDSSKAKYILYVLHGYGQLAEFFIRNFQSLNSDYFVIAPEGMHRFYLQGSSGQVGASWMTKEARNQDIQDTTSWLDQLDHEMNLNFTFEKKIILGFSQGGATAARWSNLGKIKADSIIYWASVFPPDLENNNLKEPKLKEENYFIIGDNDEYYSKQESEKTIKDYQEKGFKTILFKGKHEINTATLNLVLNNLLESY